LANLDIPSYTLLDNALRPPPEIIGRSDRGAGTWASSAQIAATGQAGRLSAPQELGQSRSSSPSAGWPRLPQGTPPPTHHALATPRAIRAAPAIRGCRVCDFWQIRCDCPTSGSTGRERWLSICPHQRRVRAVHDRPHRSCWCATAWRARCSVPVEEGRHSEGCVCKCPHGLRPRSFTAAVDPGVGHHQQFRRGSACHTT
jgi:hypothetical protein